MTDAIQRLTEYETAGDPMTELKWTRKTTEKISRQLRRVGIPVSPKTVARLLKDAKYSLRVNRKMISRSNSPDRDQQFRYIHKLRNAFSRDGLPVISVDTKKKELVGQFKNPGRVWAQAATLVNDHDFRSDAKGIAVPYGIYDVPANRGHIFVGRSHDTPAFATDVVGKWWRCEGRRRYPRADRILILADGGGSNGSRVRAWKLGLQKKLCDRFGLAVTVCHYPASASKWNPVEHRLFSEVSKNWAGRPLDNFETMAKYIRRTETSTGLRVRATLVRRHYLTGVKVNAGEMKSLNLQPHRVIPKLNYTLRPAQH